MYMKMIFCSLCDHWLTCLYACIYIRIKRQYYVILNSMWIFWLHFFLTYMIHIRLILPPLFLVKWLIQSTSCCKLSMYYLSFGKFIVFFLFSSVVLFLLFHIGVCIKGNRFPAVTAYSSSRWITIDDQD
jgi:hypothetical protein